MNEEIKVNAEKVNELLSKLFPILEESVFAKEITGDEMYFGIMVLVFINQIAAQQNGITSERLQSIELAAAKHIIEYESQKNKFTQGKFYN